MREELGPSDIDTEHERTLLISADRIERTAEFRVAQNYE